MYIQLKNKRGVIHHIKDSGDLLVKYGANSYIINQAAVVKVCFKSLCLTDVNIVSEVKS